MKDIHCVLHASCITEDLADIDNGHTRIDVKRFTRAKEIIDALLTKKVLYADRPGADKEGIEVIVVEDGDHELFRPYLDPKKHRVILYGAYLDMCLEEAAEYFEAEGIQCEFHPEGAVGEDGVDTFAISDLVSRKRDSF